MEALRPSELSKNIVRKYLGLASTDPLPILPNRSSMNVMLWNCRGADNKIFRRNFRELVRLHHPNVVALFETKVFFSSMGLFFNHLGFTASTIVDPVGRVGGIWLIWNPSQVLATVYASPNIGMCQNLWNELENSANTIGSPWLVAGDFNDIMGQNERRSFSQNRQNYRCRKFLDNINRCGLMDLGCTGSKFTWSNNRQGMANTMERLNRALCNAEWRTTFPEGAVRNLPWTYSDHSSIMVYTEGTIRGLTTDDTCPHCQLYCEDLNHLLRECHQSAEVWETLTHHSWRAPSTLSSLDTWLQHNLKSKNRECFNIPWDTVFVVTLWRLWKARNNVVFNQEAIHTQELVRQIQHEAAEIHYVVHTDHFTAQHRWMLQRQPWSC
ncbi:unnamed protein product [Camellia sinensis]